MPDDKTTKVPETAAPDTGPGKPPEQAPVKEPVKTEPPTPEQKPPEQAADKAASPKDKEAPTSEKAGAEKSPNVSVSNRSTGVHGGSRNPPYTLPRKSNAPHIGNA